MSCGKYLTIDKSKNIGCKNAHTNIDKCNVISLTKKEQNKYHNMNGSSHFTMFKRNQAILDTSNDTVSKKQRDGVGAGRSKHGSYQRYLASKTAKAGYCKPSQAVKDEYENKITTSSGDAKCHNIKNYMGFLRHYRCHSGLSKQIDLHADTLSSCSK